MILKSSGIKQRPLFLTLSTIEESRGLPVVFSVVTRKSTIVDLGVLPRQSHSIRKFIRTESPSWSSWYFFMFSSRHAQLGSWWRQPRFQLVLALASSNSHEIVSVLQLLNKNDESSLNLFLLDLNKRIYYYDNRIIWSVISHIKAAHREISVS